MKSRDLQDEIFAAAHRIRLSHFSALATLGVSPQAVGRLNCSQPSIGAVRIEDMGGGLFQPSDTGEGACIVACCGPEDEWGNRPINDLIAFHIASPDRWWWRTGEASLLGEHMVVNDIGEPVPVVATPADWLALAGHAICILDWSNTSPAWPALRSGPSLSFSDGALRQKVRDALVETARLPHMDLAA